MCGAGKLSCAHYADSFNFVPTQNIGVDETPCSVRTFITMLHATHIVQPERQVLQMHQIYRAYVDNPSYEPHRAFPQALGSRDFRSFLENSVAHVLPVFVAGQQATAVEQLAALCERFEVRVKCCHQSGGWESNQ